MYRALILAASLLFVTPAWAEKVTVTVPIEEVLGKKGARVLHSHGEGAAIVMSVELDGYLYMCFQGLDDGRLTQHCFMEMENNFVPIPAD